MYPGLRAVTVPRLEHEQGRLVEVGYAERRAADPRLGGESVVVVGVTVVAR